MDIIIAFYQKLDDPHQGGEFPLRRPLNTVQQRRGEFEMFVFEVGNPRACDDDIVVILTRPSPVNVYMSAGEKDLPYDLMKS